MPGLHWRRSILNSCRDSTTAESVGISHCTAQQDPDIQRVRGTTTLLKGCCAILTNGPVMSRPGQRSSNLLIALVKSYGRDLKHGLRGLTTRYAAGAGLLGSGVLFLVVAAGVAISAAFHALEIHYGAHVAYGVVGGTFLLLGVAGLVAGRVIFLVQSHPCLRQNDSFKCSNEAATAPAIATLVAQGGRRVGASRSGVVRARGRSRSKHRWAGW